MDNQRLAKLIADLYNVVDGLDQMFSDCQRRFTPDGHLVGSIGEAVCQNIYDLTLQKSSKAGWDAVIGGKTIQIKTTSVSSISLRAAETYADCLLVIKLDPRSGFTEIFAGSFPRHLLNGKNPDRRGYYSLSLSALNSEHSHQFVQNKSFDDLNRAFSQERHG